MRQVLGVFFGIGLILALITSFIVLGYIIKIAGFLIAVICVGVFVVILIGAAIKEFVFDARKKPPK